MTREERIDWLCRLRSWVVAPPLMTAEQKSKFIEALTETIEALQTEPCEDCISRQAVLDILDRHTLSRMALYEIEDLPSVQPFINKPCVSEQACHEDKMKVLEKIKAEIEQDAFKDVNGSKYISVNRVNQIINKYTEEVMDDD